MPNSSTILLLLVTIFLTFIFISYKLLFKNIHDNHIKNQQLTFNLIQRESNNLLTKLLYEYSKQRSTLLEKHKLVLDYLKNNSYDTSLDEIYKNLNNSDTPFYNIYITDEDLVITNTTFKPDLGFNLSFAKETFDKHKLNNVIGVSPPIFEMYSMQFFSFTDSYLPKNDKRVLQVGYVYEDLNQDLKNLQELINQNKDIKDSNAYLIFNDGYVGDFVFKSIKPHKPSLEEVHKRLEDGKKLSNSINDGEYRIDVKRIQKNIKLFILWGKVQYLMKQRLFIVLLLMKRNI